MDGDTTLKRRFGWLRRWPVMPVIELSVLGIAIAIAFGTYFIIDGQDSAKLLTPPIVALLLVANLLPYMALLVLIGRRIAKRRAARFAGGGSGRLHVRLVAVFSILASVPIVLTVIAASIMFQSVNSFWTSSRTKATFDTTMTLLENASRQARDQWIAEANAMAIDMSSFRRENPHNANRLNNYLVYQSFNRNLDEAVLFTSKGDDGINILGVCNYPKVCYPPNEKAFEQRLTPKLLKLLRDRPHPAIDRTPDTIWVVVKVPQLADTYLYIGTGEDAQYLDRQMQAARHVISDYKVSQRHARALQLKFNIALFAVAVLIIAITVWIALTVADRLVRPINNLVEAAHRIAVGDLAVRVPEPTIDDEIGTLGTAFNSMTERLQEQTSELVEANEQIESRRALIEAVMSGVSAGVISIDGNRTIRLINSSASELLAIGEEGAAGRPLADISTELDAVLDGDSDEMIAQITAGGDAKTLAVKITHEEDGQILTFDDITQQLLDQRRAAWSDVARRIAHEIKNPLTPIQLAAERLQRRYGKDNDGKEDDGTFTRLTGTIIRQVGDLRRMVDEFSSFARMPKPVFRDESLVDIVRQTVFLHEVAHAGIDFVVEHDEPGPHLVCDRRQLGQALTNITKNAVEAVVARGDDAEPRGEIHVRIAQDEGAGQVTVEIADNGIGLPVERDRIVEPYMTTRDRGTGLGLAIVKKIVEEHFGTVVFSDRPESGTCVTLTFDAKLLAGLDASGKGGPESEAPPTALTRNRNG